MGLIDDLKNAIQRDERSLRALARDAGLSPIQLSRFIRDVRGLNSPAMDKLCEALGLKLAPKRKR